MERKIYSFIWRFALITVFIAGFIGVVWQAGAHAAKSVGISQLPGSSYTTWYQDRLTQPLDNELDNKLGNVPDNVLDNIFDNELDKVLDTKSGADHYLAQATGSGDPAKGKLSFNVCKVCHSIAASGDHERRIGPNLFGIVMANVASRPDYQYSAALKKYGGVWSEERLDAFLAAPQKLIKGSKMIFPGLQRADDRANVIAYLRSVTTGDGDDTAPAESSEAIAEDFGLLKNAPGVDITFYACTVCHSEQIIVQQGFTRKKWDELLQWMVDEHGMADLVPEDETVILDYLSEHYNTDRPNLPR